VVRTALNIAWLVFSDFWLALGYALAGIIMFVLIITIPFGRQAFKARYSLWSFGVHGGTKRGSGRGIGRGNIPWFLLCGWWLALLRRGLLARSVLRYRNFRRKGAEQTKFGRVGGLS
jgi:uncharacterized membrane protein YccF (DUF307 family)